MKKISKKLIILLVIIVVIYLVLYAIVAIFGKGIAVSQIETNLKRKAALQNIGFGLPFSINITGLEIENFLKADSISLRPSILGFLAGKVVLSDLRISRPVITIQKRQDGTFDIPMPPPGKDKQPPILLAGLKVDSGKLIFTDRKLSGHQIILNAININISKISLPPTSLFTRFNISSQLVDEENTPKGEILASGWIDFGLKNMDGKMELKDIDATYLAPYYGNIIFTKKLLSAKLNFTSDLKAKDNNLIAKCHVEFSDLVYEKPAQTEEGQAPNIDLFPKILDVFTGVTGKIVFDFAINTKLDNPRLDLLQLKGSIAQAATQNIVNQPPENVIEKVKETAKEFKDLGKALKDIFKKQE